MTATRSSVDNFPSDFPMGGSGAPAATDGAPDSVLAPQVTKNSAVKRITKNVLQKRLILTPLHQKFINANNVWLRLRFMVFNATFNQ